MLTKICSQAIRQIDRQLSLVSETPIALFEKELGDYSYKAIQLPWFISPMLSLEAEPLTKAVFFDKEALLGHQHQTFERNCFEIFSYLEDSQGMQTYLVSEALAAHGKKRYRSAIGFLNKAQQISDQPLIRFNLGVGYLQCKQFQKAVDSFLFLWQKRHELGGCKWLGGLCNNLALAYMREGAIDKAEQWLLRASDYDQNNVLILLNQGRLYDEKGGHDQGLSCYEKALDKSDESMVAVPLIGAKVSFLKGEEEQAYHYLEQLSRPDKQGAALFNKSLLLARKGRIEEAYKTVSELIRCRPEDKASRCLSAIISVLNGDYDGAVRDYSHYSDDAYINYLLAKVYQLQDQTSDALNCYEYSVQTSPEVWWELSHLRQIGPQQVQAMEQYQEAFPDRVDGYLALAGLAIERAAFDQAYVATQRGLVLQPENRLLRLLDAFTHDCAMNRVSHLLGLQIETGFEGIHAGLLNRCADEIGNPEMSKAYLGKLISDAPEYCQWAIYCGERRLLESSLSDIQRQVRRLGDVFPNDIDCKVANAWVAFHHEEFAISSEIFQLPESTQGRYTNVRRGLAQVIMTQGVKTLDKGCDFWGLMPENYQQEEIAHDLRPIDKHLLPMMINVWLLQPVRAFLSQPERTALATMETRLNLTFCCPIERDAFVEPVRLSCHHTFNKEAMLQWHRINTRQPNCPECRHRLPVKESRKLACKQPNEGVLARQDAWVAIKEEA